MIAPQIADPRDYLRLGEAVPRLAALRAACRGLAARCLFDTTQTREYDVSLALSCLGALKYNNLGAHQRHLLLLTAADLFTRI